MSIDNDLKKMVKNNKDSAKNATSEVPYSALPELTEAQDSTILSVVDTSANFKINALNLQKYILNYANLNELNDIQDSTLFSVLDSPDNFKLTALNLQKYIIGNKTLKIIWTIADGTQLDLTEVQVLTYERIIITTEAITGGSFKLTIPSSVFDDISNLEITIDYSACTFTDPKVLTIEQSDGTLIYDSFVMVSDSSISSLGIFAKKYSNLKFKFTIDESKFRHPYGLINDGTFTSSETVSSQVPPENNTNVTYKIKYIRASEEDNHVSTLLPNNVSSTAYIIFSMVDTMGGYKSIIYNQNYTDNPGFQVSSDTAYIKIGSNGSYSKIGAVTNSRPDFGEYASYLLGNDEPLGQFRNIFIRTSAIPSAYVDDRFLILLDGEL